MVHRNYELSRTEKLLERQLLLKGQDSAHLSNMSCVEVGFWAGGNWVDPEVVLKTSRKFTLLPYACQEQEEHMAGLHHGDTSRVTRSHLGWMGEHSKNRR